jgi:hypothetical protein
MKKTYSDLPEWSFELDEVSANVYEVVGTDRMGHRVSSTGIDLDQIIEQCKKNAWKIGCQSVGRNK